MDNDLNTVLSVQVILALITLECIEYHNWKPFWMVSENTRLALEEIISRGDIMADNKTQDYFDDKGEGHTDTRERNFESANMQV